MLNHISSLGTSCTVRSLVGVRPCMPHSEAKKKKKGENPQKTNQKTSSLHSYKREEYGTRARRLLQAHSKHLPD